MTAKERAEAVDIVETDFGDCTVAEWRVDYTRTRRNIADAIEAAILEEREACAKIVSAATSYEATGDRQIAHLGNMITQAIRERGLT